MEWALRHECWVKLANGTSRKVTRIGKGWLASSLLPLVERRKVALEHDDFPTDLRPALQQVLKARCFAQTQRHIANRPHIIRYIFANVAIAPCDRLHEHTIVIDKRAGQAIHLDIGKKFVLVTWQELIHALYPRLDLCRVEDIIEANHPPAMLHLDEATFEDVADPLGGRIGRDECRVRRLELLELGKEAVVHRVAHAGRIKHMVFVAIAIE